MKTPFGDADTPTQPKADGVSHCKTEVPLPMPNKNVTGQKKKESLNKGKESNTWGYSSLYPQPVAELWRLREC